MSGRSSTLLVQLEAKVHKLHSNLSGYFFGHLIF